MKYRKIFITGGAGFVGSNLCDRLLADGYRVTAYDNLSTGFLQFLKGAQTKKGFQFIRGDILNKTDLVFAMKGCDFVFHIAANADVRFGTDHPERDLQQNTIATFNVLEAMRTNRISCIAFSSTGSVYGEAAVFPTPEDTPFPVQTSLYGASKVACESLIEAYCAGFGFRAWIFRFVSLLGERYTHGHVFDFYRQLLENPKKLRVLGNGKQKKSYLYIQDCIDAILLALEKADRQINIFNLGRPDYSEVDDSVKWICETLGVLPQVVYTGGERGWIGDSPFIFLDTKRIQKLGWKPRVSIPEAIKKTVGWLEKNQWVFNERK